MKHEVIRGVIAILSCDACDFGEYFVIPLIQHSVDA